MTRLPKTYGKFLLCFIKAQQYSFIGMLLLTTLCAITSSLWPKVTGYIVDVLNTSEQSKMVDNQQVQYGLIIILLFWLSYELLCRLRGFLFASTMPQFEANMRMGMCKHILHNSYHYFTSNLIGGMANRISDLPRASKLLIDIILVNILPTVITILVSSALFFEMQWELALILGCWLVCYLALCTYFGSSSAYYAKQQNACLAKLNGKIVDSITNHVNILLLRGHGHEMEYLDSAQQEEKQQYRKNLFYIESSKTLLGVLSLISISLLFYYTIYLWQSGKISTGNVVTVITSTLNLMLVMVSMNDEFSYLFREIGACQTSVNMMQDPQAMAHAEETPMLKVTKGQLVFNRVSFRYGQGRSIFHNKSLTIFGGQKVGLAGLSGSGKSTFANLILRLYDVDAGSIMIDGQNISTVELRSLYRQVSLVPQNPILFHRSIMENIRYARPEATDGEVIEAAKKSASHAFIMEMEHGYNTLVGERGSLLSGGQLQRIAVARAILQNAPIVIMDEATSSLDAITEQELQQSIKALMQGKTSIIIAHRLTTLLDVDRILVFANGRIVEDGPHQELIKNNGHYAMLWKMQQNGILPSQLQ